MRGETFAWPAFWGMFCPDIKKKQIKSTAQIFLNVLVKINNTLKYNPFCPINVQWGIQNIQLIANKCATERRLHWRDRWFNQAAACVTEGSKTAQTAHFACSPCFNLKHTEHLQ